MKKLITLALLLSTMAAAAKTTYIPKYRTYIHVAEHGDTVSATGNLTELALCDRAGMFRITVYHEEVTKEKVKAIKRKKAAAGWATFAAVMGGVSAAFSDNSLQYIVRSANAQVSAELAGIYVANAKDEATLKIEADIENLSDEELMVADEERGLVWFIEKGQTMTLAIHNPEAARLRISSTDNRWVKRAAILAGSANTKYEVAWEDEEQWIVARYKETNMTGVAPLLGYTIIRKSDYSEQNISIDDFLDLKKELKRKQKDAQ